jgi:hypothetical protein
MEYLPPLTNVGSTPQHALEMQDELHYRALDAAEIHRGVSGYLQRSGVHRLR